MLSSTEESLLIMAIGMSSVFIFLGILVISLQISNRFFASWPLDESISHPNPNSTSKKTASTRKESTPQKDDEDVLIAVALAAIQHQRSQL